MKASQKQLALAVVSLLSLVPATSRASIVVTIEKPGIQQSTVEGVKTETFDTLSTGLYKEYKSEIGFYTGSGNGFAIVKPDAFGGAEQTKYMSIGAQSRQLDATLQLTGPQAYFGFLWLAGDALNKVEFYSKDQLVTSFSTAAVLNYVVKTGGPYGRGHMGNPNTNQNTSEPYAYLNFYANEGTVFDKIIFRNTSTGTGFETDNHSIRAEQVEDPTGTPVVTLSGVPEPATLGSAVLAGLTALGVAYRKQKSQAH